jgi:hypothetical protein
MVAVSMTSKNPANPRAKAWLTALGAVATAVAVLACGAPASAEEILVESPANWRLQNYVNNSVVIWFTGVQAHASTRRSCSTGPLFAAGRLVR